MSRVDSSCARNPHPRSIPPNCRHVPVAARGAAPSSRRHRRFHLLRERAAADLEEQTVSLQASDCCR